MPNKRHTEKFKRQVVKETIETGNSSIVGRKHNINASIVARWVRTEKPNPMINMRKKAKQSIPGLSEDPKEVKQAVEQTLQLKKLIGDKELEIAILRDLLKKTKIPYTSKVMIASKWIGLGYEATKVLKIIDLNSSTYYYATINEDEEKEENGGRPIPGYAYTIEGKKICDMQIKEWIVDLIEGDCFAYGYYKLTIELRKAHKLIINKKKVYRLCREYEGITTSAKNQIKISEEGSSKPNSDSSQSVMGNRYKIRLYCWRRQVFLYTVYH